MCPCVLPTRCLAKCSLVKASSSCRLHPADPASALQQQYMQGLKPLVRAGGDVYSTLKRCPELLSWDKLGRRIALDVALGLNYLHSR